MAKRARTTRHPLDQADAAKGANPRSITRAVNRSVERVGAAAMPKGTGTMAPDAKGRNRRKMAAVADEKARTRETPNPRKQRQNSPAAGRKGGPGKRRATPKKGKHAGR